jgi:hypothetical protein
VLLLPRPSDTNSEGSTEKGAAVVVSSVRPAVDLRQFLCAATKQRELSLASIGVWSQRAEVAALPLLRRGCSPTLDATSPPSTRASCRCRWLPCLRRCRGAGDRSRRPC